MTELRAVYTDGASSPDGCGGWAWTDGVHHDSGYAYGTTNQRMELMAALEAIDAHHHEPIAVHSDSAYLVNCFTAGWHLTWVANGWVSSAEKPVANRDLWEPLVALAIVRATVFVKIKGHSGVVLNEAADALAVTAKRVAQARAGGLVRVTGGS